jgi:hypothetical protein
MNDQQTSENLKRAYDMATKVFGKFLIQCGPTLGNQPIAVELNTESSDVAEHYVQIGSALIYVDSEEARGIGSKVYDVLIWKVFQWKYFAGSRDEPSFEEPVEVAEVKHLHEAFKEAMGVILTGIYEVNIEEPDF